MSEFDARSMGMSGTQVKEQETFNYKCSSCGASMEYDPATKQMKCSYCGATCLIEVDFGVENKELDFNMESQVQWGAEVRSFSCANCGAKTVFDSKEFSKECAFCGSPNIAEINELPGIRPNAVLPFHLTKEQASASYNTWIKKRFFAPGKFKKDAAVHSVRGVYTPCWSFNAKTYSSYHARVGNYYTVVVGSGKNRRVETRIRWRHVSGNFALDFANMIIEASPHMTQKEMDKIQPFPVTGAVVYNKSFLSGFSADHYDKSLNEGWSEARSRMDTAIYNGIRTSLRCDVVDYIRPVTAYRDKSYKYILLPVYVGGTKWKEKLYNFFVNGVTGRTTGSAPVSAAKVSILAVIIAAVIAAAAITYFLVTS